jgi:hypothetical protein
VRAALNSNPVVQIAVIGVLIAVVGLFLMMNMKKSDSSSSSPTTSSDTASGSTAAATTSPVTVPGASATSGAATPSVGATTTPPASGGTVSPEALIPGPGLPRDVVAAWKRGDAIALLIVRPQGVDDRLVRSSVNSLSGEPNVAVFVTRAEHVARYSRITQGVGVDHAPALVVVRPRSESGPTPQAQVSYGFRNSKSVLQAVHDAIYSGQDNLPYYPR